MGHPFSDDKIETSVMAEEPCGREVMVDVNDCCNSGPINLELALGNCLGDRDFLAKILDKFLLEMGSMIEEIRLGIEDGDLTGVGEAAHQLKGTAGLLGCMDLYERFSELYGATQQHGAREDLLNLLGEISVQYVTVKTCAMDLGLC